MFRLSLMKMIYHQNINSHGVVVPGVSNKNIDGIQFSSYKWEGRVDEGKVLIRSIFWRSEY